MQAILLMLAKYKTMGKIGGTVAGGSGILLLIGALHSDLKGEIEQAEARSKSFVNQKVEINDLRFKSIDKDIDYIRRSIDKQNTILQRIDNRVYELNIKNQ